MVRLMSQDCHSLKGPHIHQSCCCHLCCADLINVFEVFLPQLLLYPNPSDPLNGEAASLLMREPQMYNQRVRGEDGGCKSRWGARVQAHWKRHVVHQRVIP